jgi:hypothetical protein
VARLGALITVLTIAIDPFSQQLLQFRQSVQFVARSQDEASIPRAERYSRGNEFFFPSGVVEIAVEDGVVVGGSQLAFPDADFPLQAATIFGISAPVDRISQQVDFKCRTSQCRYPKFKSLGVCSRCKNLDSHLEENTASDGTQYVGFERVDNGLIIGKNQTEYRLPNGLFINNIGAGNFRPKVYLTMAGTPHPENTITMQDVDTLIWSQSLIRIQVTDENRDNAWPDYPIHATECALYYCVQEYTSEVNNGTLAETSAETDDKRNPESWQVYMASHLSETGPEGLSAAFNKSTAFNETYSFARRTDLQLGDRFNLSQAAVDGTSRLMQETFGPCLDGSRCDFDRDPINGYYMSRNLIDQGTAAFEPPVAQVLFEAADVGDLFGGLARSMSNAIRNGADATAEESAGARVVGLVGVDTTVYHVDWRWIALHGLVELGAILFLGATVWTSSSRLGRAIPAWKSSSLAALFKGPEGLRRALENASTTAALDDSARGILLSLAREAGDYGRGVEDQVVKT